MGLTKPFKPFWGGGGAGGGGALGILLMPGRPAPGASLSPAVAARTGLLGVILAASFAPLLPDLLPGGSMPLDFREEAYRATLISYMRAANGIRSL